MPGRARASQNPCVFEVAAGFQVAAGTRRATNDTVVNRTQKALLPQHGLITKE
jgi:hypothetical protein